METVKEFQDYLSLLSDNGKMTAEMIVNEERDTAAYVARRLDKFPRALIAKKAIDERMYALEPYKTRPTH